MSTITVWVLVAFISYGGLKSSPMVVDNFPSKEACEAFKEASDPTKIIVNGQQFYAKCHEATKAVIK